VGESLVQRFLPKAPTPGEVVMVKPKERESGQPAFSGLTAILYVILVAMDVENAEEIAQLFSSRLGSKTIVSPIDAEYLAQIVRDARGIQ
jgi:hypothetical protein